jgi:hypothetical protein
VGRQVCALLLDTDFDEFVLVTKLEDLPDKVIAHRAMHNCIHDVGCMFLSPGLHRLGSARESGAGADGVHALYTR